MKGIKQVFFIFKTICLLAYQIQKTGSELISDQSLVN